MSPLPTAPASSGVKRPHTDSSMANDQKPAKRRRVVRTLHHVQNRPQHIEPAPQNPIFAQGQLLKSIGAALVMAGFDGVQPSALEMFRAQTEEYMLKFLSHAHFSMQDNRRTRPTAMDFAASLANMPHASTASLLEPHLDVSIPQDISCPVLSEPLPAPPPAPDFAHLLQPLITTHPPAYIPSHFPSLPPQHAWRQTPVFPEREKDARKMREKATEEGMLAEQALRKLAAAAKAGAMNAETRRNSTLSGVGKLRTGVPAKTRARVSEDTLADVLKDIGSSDEAVESEMNGLGDGRADLAMPEGIAVNHEIWHWRRHGARKAMRT